MDVFVRRKDHTYRRRLLALPQHVTTYTRKTVEFKQIVIVQFETAVYKFRYCFEEKEKTVGKIPQEKQSTQQKRKKVS